MKQDIWIFPGWNFVQTPCGPPCLDYRQGQCYNNKNQEIEDGGMNMSLVLAKCTQCGSVLQVDGMREAAICQHCGSAFVVEKAVHNYSIQNHITAETVNVYGIQQDFVIRAGVLEKYQGASADVVVPDTVTIIGDGAFRDCAGLRSVILPDSVTAIGAYAFANCTNLCSIVLGSSVRQIGNAVSGKEMGHTFENCTSLQDVELPESLETLEEAVFLECKALRHIQLPPALRQVGYLCFGNCSGLTEVRIGSYDTRIDRGAFGMVGRAGKFYHCASLSQVHIPYTSNPERYYQLFRGTPWTRNSFSSQGRCVFCGGQFKGLFKKVCRNCLREKTY